MNRPALRFRGWTVLCAFAVLVAARAAHAQESFDDRMRRELRTQDPTAVDAFDQANAARERGELEQALRGYERVHAQVPTFVHATRRACTTLLELGRRDEALPLCRAAVAAVPDLAENHIALAEVLAWHARGAPTPGAAALTEARDEADRAQETAPDELATQGARCDVAVERNDGATLVDCAARLRRIEPDALVTLLFGVLAAMHREEWSEAATTLERARVRGLPPAQYARLADVLRRASPWPLRAWPYVWRFALAWLAAFALLFAAGGALSVATLAATRARTVGAHPALATRVVRRLYAVVLAASCALYYVTLPIIALMLVAVVGALVWVCWTGHELPVRAIALVGFGVCVTLWSLVRSLLVRASDKDPGARLDLAAHPALRGTLDEVARRIGTRPVDAVFITPDADVAVFERGSLARQLRGATERCLLLGIAVLDGMSTLELKAVLAHEYGHFRNEDTAGGRLALATRVSMQVFATGLARGGAATWYNPAWLFVTGFYRVFLRVSQGASRLQEILADRWAAHTYGAEAFVRGLHHSIERNVQFEAHVVATLAEAVPAQRPVPNLYGYVPQNPVAPSEIARVVATLLDARPSAYDSHPAPTERFERVRALALDAPDATVAPDPPAWSLLADRAALEAAMTDVIRASLLARNGLRLVAALPERAA